MWFHLTDDAIDRAVDRIAREVSEPLRVHRALTEFRSPSRTMTCTVGRDPDRRGQRGPQWQTGRAVITPGHFVFLAAPGGSALYRLDVHAVVETDETRTSDEEAPGPRRLAVWKLLTTDGTLYWAAHRRVLTEATAVLRGTGRT
ncbi:hypothetical protein [uncultured Jatrophihabitans sp.]|uniref:hypothetical protein n=1 Tax=uncultured Jatrophihabitans sp. TaxID=1610747 RepID=UPI0035CB2B9E